MVLTGASQIEASPMRIILLFLECVVCRVDVILNGSMICSDRGDVLIFQLRMKVL